MFKLDDYLKAPVFTKIIEDEVLPPSSLKCFLGAWYYKVVSAKDKWLGMEAIVTLPEFIPDEQRFVIADNDVDKSKKVKKYLDTPSVYLGGSSDYETDIGLAWFHGLVDGKYSEEKIAFRPFWRTIFMEDNQIKNVYKGTQLKEVEYYYFPGDTLKLNLVCTENNYLQLRIEVIKQTSIEKYRKIREINNVAPGLLLTDRIIAPGNGIRPTEYKRVNAIDQYSNEGKPTKMTNAKVLESNWSNVYLYREIDGNLYKIPFSKDRQLSVTCPDSSGFVISNNDNSEVVEINPGNK